MARIVVTAAAYLGDVAPFVAPANELAARGHDVTLLVPQGFHPLFAGERFHLEPYTFDFSSSAMHTDPEHQRLMRHPLRNQLRLPTYWMRQGYFQDPARARRGLEDSLRGADVLVTHATFGSVTMPIAQHLGIPVVVGHFFPMLVPTEHHTPPFPSRLLNLGRPLNRASWNLVRRLSGKRMFDDELNALRREFGLAPHRAAALVTWMDAVRTVMLVSPHYAPPAPPDWPSMTWAGFSTWDGPAGRTAEPAVDAFLDAGDAPVLVTLGTSAATGAGKRFAAIGNGLDRLGLRSLHLVADEQNLPPLRGRDGVFVFAPVAQVLPRCRVAVVSGALGALSTALLAGVPVVVMPQLFDQLWHGRRVEQLGVGVMAYTPAGVVRAVRRIERDPRFRERAAELAAKMAGEDGPNVLADVVESVVA